MRGIFLALSPQVHALLSMKHQPYIPVLGAGYIFLSKLWLKLYMSNVIFISYRFIYSGFQMILFGAKVFGNKVSVKIKQMK